MIEIDFTQFSRSYQTLAVSSMHHLLYEVERSAVLKRDCAARLSDFLHRMGRKVLGEVANVAPPDTMLAWYRKAVARKFDGSKARGPARAPGSIATLSS